jgi:hypothetical protein
VPFTVRDTPAFLPSHIYLPSPALSRHSSHLHQSPALSQHSSPLPHSSALKLVYAYGFLTSNAGHCPLQHHGAYKAPVFYRFSTNMGPLTSTAFYDSLQHTDTYKAPSCSASLPPMSFTRTHLWRTEVPTSTTAMYAGQMSN